MTQPTLLVIDYLRAGGTYESLLTEHGVRAKPHNGKISFIYDMLSSHDDDRLAQQCRGLILREGSLDIIAYPFDRFFNHGQGAAAQIDWASARFEEKLDGSLLITYWDDVDGHWRCGTRSMCEAHGQITGGQHTFATLADVAAAQHARGALGSLNALMIVGRADIGTTYMIELTGPHNRVVCEYPELGLTLIGARRLSDLREVDPELEAERIGLPTPKSWRFSSIADLMEVMREWSPLQYEGVVVKDSAFNRVKVKSPQYLAAHHAIDSLGASWRAVCEAILTGHADDIEAAVPAFVRERIAELRIPIAQLVVQVERDYAELRNIEDIKTFALAAQQRFWSSPLFAMKRGKATDVASFVGAANPDTVLELCRKLGWRGDDLVALDETL